MKNKMRHDYAKITNQQVTKILHQIIPHSTMVIEI